LGTRGEQTVATHDFTRKSKNKASRGAFRHIVLVVHSAHFWFQCELLFHDKETVNGLWSEIDKLWTMAMARGGGP
jgi:hypothetical protein